MATGAGAGRAGIRLLGLGGGTVHARSWTSCGGARRRGHHLLGSRTLQLQTARRSSTTLRRAYASVMASQRGLWPPSSRNLTCAHLPNARWISTSRPQLEDASKPSPAQANAIPSNHQPPLPVRIALVSTTAALATPTFPALGFLYLVLRVTVPDANLRKAMEGRWGTLLSFTTWTLLPNLYHGTVASLILPCAVGNAIVAGGVYGLVDLACGGPNSTSQGLNKALQTSWITGSGIGATVGYVAPNYVYGPVMENMYALDGMSQSMQHVMGLPYATEVSVATGAVAGMLLHPLLYFPINGVQSLHWGAFSGTALAAASAALFYVYYGRDEAGLPVPEGSFVEPSKLALVDAIARYNNGSGGVETYSLKEAAFVGPLDHCIEGREIADASRLYAASGKAVFDDRLVAFLYNYWDVKTKERYPEHVVAIPTRPELEKTQSAMAMTDASVAAMIDEDCDVMKILATVNEQTCERKDQKQLSRTAERLAGVSAAIELLMVMKRSGTQPPTVDVPTLERFVRSRCPEITLYASDERYRDESVESQLRLAGWKGPELSEAVGKWTRVHAEERRRSWRNRALVAGAGILLSVLASMLQGSR